MRQIDMLLMKYGMTLTLEQVAEVLHLSPGAIKNKRSAGTFAIPLYLEGRQLLADVRHVAEHLERRASEARAKAEGECTASRSANRSAA